jgi:prepilin-type N-terminal cleavage/methylation domain-containing protein
MRSHRRQFPRWKGGHAKGAFTLVELVMVVTIIGIVAAIAVPRMSGVSQRATSAALSATLETVRGAIDRYYAEHDRYPGYNPSTGLPDGDAFVQQLLQYTNAKGEPQTTYGHPYINGPYVRSPFPTNPFNNLKTVHVKNLRTDPDPAEGTVGWIAVLSDGTFGLSVTDSELDGVGVKPQDRPKFQLN